MGDYGFFLTFWLVYLISQRYCKKNDTTKFNEIILGLQTDFSNLQFHNTLYVRHIRFCPYSILAQIGLFYGVNLTSWVMILCQKIIADFQSVFIENIFFERDITQCGLKVRALSVRFSNRFMASPLSNGEMIKQIKKTLR